MAFRTAVRLGESERNRLAQWHWKAGRPGLCGTLSTTWQPYWAPVEFTPLASTANSIIIAQWT